jgi:hypothetical protein
MGLSTVQSETGSGKPPRAARGAFWTDFTGAAGLMHSRVHVPTPKPRRAMATRLQRPRILPTWRAGLRLGKERDTMTAYLAEHPEFAQRLLEIIQEVRAQGYEPVPMDRVKQPFDYERC